MSVKAFAKSGIFNANYAKRFNVLSFSTGKPKPQPRIPRISANFKNKFAPFVSFAVFALRSLRKTINPFGKITT